MILLRDKESGVDIGSITEDQLQFLIDQLEEESETDQDYYLNRTMLDMLEGRKADPALAKLLRDALGDRDDMEIQWSRT